jgi:tetratricopeptide (TPR) repeat protein
MNGGNPQGAIDPLRKVLAADPNHALAHAYLAMCLHDTREYKKANAEIDAALDRAPEDGFVRYVAGIVALLQRKHRTAEAHLEAARRLSPTDARVFRSLAQLYDETNRQQQSLPMLQEGLKHEPTNLGLRTDIGSHLFESGRFAEAEAMASEVLAANPENADAQVLMGQIRLHSLDPAGAREHALLALRANPLHDGALRLICAIKFLANPLLGLWWHIAMRTSRLLGMLSGFWRTVILPIPAIYITITLLHSRDRSSLILLVLWVGFMGYLWAGGIIFERMINRELRFTRLRRDF